MYLLSQKPQATISKVFVATQICLASLWLKGQVYILKMVFILLAGRKVIFKSRSFLFCTKGLQQKVILLYEENKTQFAGSTRLSSERTERDKDTFFEKQLKKEYKKSKVIG